MATDANDLYRLSRELDSLARQLEGIAPELADARAAKDFDSDRRKNLLASFMAPLLADNSATAAEALARANPEYQERFKALHQDLLTAYTVVARESGLQARFEAARSILSVTKAQLSL